jgi:lysophospholipase L1-like esterase
LIDYGQTGILHRPHNGLVKMAPLRFTGRMLKIIGINLLILIFLLAVLELLVRSWHVVINKGSFLRPNYFISPWITTFDYPYPITKSDGKTYFRHRDIPTTIDKPADTVRIIAVGGSTTANNRPYSINKIDYPKSLEIKLEDGFKQLSFEVLNAGSDAYSSAQSLINIEFRLVEYNPDIILLMHTVNDASVNAFNGGATSDYSNKYLQPYYLSLSLQGSLSFVGLIAQSRLLSKIGLPGLLADRDKDMKVTDDYEFGLHLFKRNLSGIASICKLHNIDLVLLTQPAPLGTSKFTKYITEKMFLDYKNAIIEVAKEQGVHVIDMFSKYGHEEKYFVDHIHYTPEGIERFSGILYSELRNIITGVM